MEESGIRNILRYSYILSILCFLPLASGLDESDISDSSIMGDGFGLTSGTVSSYTSDGGSLIPTYTSPSYTSNEDTGFGLTSSNDYLSYTFKSTSGGPKSSFTSGIGTGLIQDFNPFTAPPELVLSGTNLMPWNAFQPSSSAPMLWVLTGTNYERKTRVEIGGILQEVISLPKSGNLVLYEIYPDLSTKILNLGYAHNGWHTTQFFADKKGVHTTIVTLNGVPSNAILIQVM